MTTGIERRWQWGGWITAVGVWGFGRELRILGPSSDKVQNTVVYSRDQDYIDKVIAFLEMVEKDDWVKFMQQQHWRMYCEGRQVAFIPGPEEDGAARQYREDGGADTAEDEVIWGDETVSRTPLDEGEPDGS